MVRAPDANLVFETTEGIDPVTSFESMGLKEHLLRGIVDCGFEEPFGIQQRAILPIIKGRNVIAQGQYHGGKTSTIAVAACQLIDTSIEEVQVLILSPTKEVAVDTEKIILAIGDHINIQAHACIGINSLEEDIKKLAGGVHVVSGTPDRDCDMNKRRKLGSGVHVVSGTPNLICYMITMGIICTTKIRLLVLDDCDELLSRRFVHDIYEMCTHLSPELQVVMIVDNLPKEIWEMTNKLVKEDPVKILVKGCNDSSHSSQGVRGYFEEGVDGYYDLRDDYLCDDSIFGDYYVDD